MAALKTLFWDLETAPLLAHIWNTTPDYIPHGQVLHDTFLLGWSAKWAVEDDVMSNVLTGEEAREQDDTRIVTNLAKLIRKADIIVAHNNDRFDLPVINSRLAALQLEPLPPVRTIDTLKLAKANFRIASNKLDYLGEFFGLGRKLHTDFTLWRRCYLGETAALKEMREYNEQDVVLLEQVFERLRPYVRSLTRLYEADYQDEVVCPWCGSHEFKFDGYRRTQAGTWRTTKCKQCGRYSRIRASEKSVRSALVPL